MTESEIQKSIIQYLRARGAIVIRMNSGKARNNVRLCPPGTPDLLAVLKTGGVLWIEVKTETGKLRPAQEEMINILDTLGQWVIVARSIEDVERGIKSFIAG